MHKNEISKFEVNSLRSLSMKSNIQVACYGMNNSKLHSNHVIILQWTQIHNGFGCSLSPSPVCLQVCSWQRSSHRWACLIPTGNKNNLQIASCDIAQSSCHVFPQITEWPLHQLEMEHKNKLPVWRQQCLSARWNVCWCCPLCGWEKLREYQNNFFVQVLSNLPFVTILYPLQQPSRDS